MLVPDIGFLVTEDSIREQSASGIRSEVLSVNDEYCKCGVVEREVAIRK
jgi:hypothetical protein